MVPGKPHPQGVASPPHGRDHWWSCRLGDPSPQPVLDGLRETSRAGMGQSDLRRGGASGICAGIGASATGQSPNGTSAPSLRPEGALGWGEGQGQLPPQPTGDTNPSQTPTAPVGTGALGKPGEALGEAAQERGPAGAFQPFPHPGPSFLGESLGSRSYIRARLHHQHRSAPTITAGGTRLPSRCSGSQRLWWQHWLMMSPSPGSSFPLQCCGTAA